MTKGYLWLGLIWLAFATEADAQTPIHLTARDYGDFEQYVFAVSWQPGFCQTQYDNKRPVPKECTLTSQAKQNYLTIHGLWPSLPHSLKVHLRASDPVSQWHRYGCAVKPLNYPQANSGAKCAAAALNLSPQTITALKTAMPGAGGQTSCLDQYEYAKHGVCFGFDQDDYFNAMVSLLHQLRNSEFGTFLADNYGKKVSLRDLKRALARSFGMKAANETVIKCSNSDKGALFTELQIPILASQIMSGLSAQSIGVREGKKQTTCAKTLLIDPYGY